MKEVDKKLEEEVVVAEVAAPIRLPEPEPQVVARPLVRLSGMEVVEEDEDVGVAPGAKPQVAESRVAVVGDEPEVAMVRLQKGKRKRV